jgi:hypothetical protein
VSVDRVYDLMRERELLSVRIGKSRRVPPTSALLDHVKGLTENVWVASRCRSTGRARSIDGLMGGGLLRSTFCGRMLVECVGLSTGRVVVMSLASWPK